MMDVVSSSLPYLADKPTIKRTLEECKGDINLAVDKLLNAEENGSQSSAQESSSVEREPDSDEEYTRGPSKKQDRRMSSRRRTKDAAAGNSLSKLATHDISQESFLSNNSSDASRVDSLHTKDIKSEEDHIKPVDAPKRPTIRIKLNPPKPPPNTPLASTTSAGKSQQKQHGPERQTAREKKDIKKQAQKAARKERQQATGGAINPDGTVKTGLSLRNQGMTATPPIESGFRTLFI